MSKFQATNLDSAYTHIKAMYNLATGRGEELASSLSSTITSLMGNWKGSDATLHINNLIGVYGKLCVLIGDVSRVAHNVSIPIVEAQTIRSANGGSGNVDTVISEYDVNMTTFDTLEDTAEYYVDPDGAKNDYNALSSLCDEFNRFQNTFGTHKDNLLDVWLDGCDREAAINTMDEFLSNAQSCYTTIGDAASYLQIAVNNFEGLSTSNLGSGSSLNTGSESSSNNYTI